LTHLLLVKVEHVTVSNPSYSV